jgi:predicted nucleotidyltransferase component of viral defense system
MLNTIKDLQNNPLFHNFYLAGGTALALQLGHRTSTDIDMFSYEHKNFFDISIFFHKNPDKYKLDIDQEGFIRAYINNVKVEFIYDDVGKLLKKPLHEEGITYLDKSEIAPMKLSAIAGRKKARDIIDIAYLLQEMPLDEMFTLYKRKYGNVNMNIVKRELINKSKIIEEDKSLKDIKMLKNDPESVLKIS